MRISNSTVVFVCLVVGTSLVLYHSSQVQVHSPVATGTATAPNPVHPGPFEIRGDLAPETAQHPAPNDFVDHNQPLLEQPNPLNRRLPPAPAWPQPETASENSLASRELPVAEVAEPTPALPEPSGGISMKIRSLNDELEAPTDSPIPSTDGSIDSPDAIELEPVDAIATTVQGSSSPVVIQVKTNAPPREANDEPRQRQPATPRYAGIQDFNAPLEADPSWVHEEQTVDRSALLGYQLTPAIESRARQMLDGATKMADRGALFAAKQQFMRIMRITCQSLDAQIGKPIHSRALAQGIRALKEADDFALTGDSLESDVHLMGFIAGHRTPVLKHANPSDMTALLAMQSYYRYAFEQLSIAGNNELVASDALYSLGRIEALLSQDGGSVSGGGPKALALYHASLTVNPGNSRAANELGVMLARRGRARDAQNILGQAARMGNQAALQNLAIVQSNLGDKIAARQSMQMAARVQQQHGAPESKSVVNKRYGGVQWVDNATFNSVGADISPVNFPSQEMANSPIGQPAVYTNPVEEKPKKKFFWPFSSKKKSTSTKPTQANPHWGF